MKIILFVLTLLSLTIAMNPKTQAFIGNKARDSNFHDHQARGISQLQNPDIQDTIQDVIKYVFNSGSYQVNSGVLDNQLLQAIYYTYGWLNIQPPRIQQFTDVLAQIIEEEQDLEDHDLSEDEFYHVFEWISTQISRSEGHSHQNYNFAKTQSNGKQHPHYNENNGRSRRRDGEGHIQYKSFPNIQILEVLLSQDGEAHRFIHHLSQSAFQRFDFNENGELDLQEAIVGISYISGQWGFDLPSYQDIEFLFNNRDLNSDNNLQLEEFEMIFRDLLQETLQQLKDEEYQANPLKPKKSGPRQLQDVDGENRTISNTHNFIQNQMKGWYDDCYEFLVDWDNYCYNQGYWLCIYEWDTYCCDESDYNFQEDKIETAHADMYQVCQWWW